MIYFIQEESSEIGNIKIGFSYSGDALRGRIKHHQCGNPRKLILIGTMEGDLEFESQLHLKFEHINIRNEWYKPSRELLWFIFSNCDCEQSEIYRQVKAAEQSVHSDAGDSVA